MNDKLREAPKNIYLQWYPEYDGSESDCTWCSDKIEENDTEYIRSDSIPKHETVEQWEERTGETYPDDGPVWYKQRDGEEWNLAPMGWCSIFREGVLMDLVIANHHGKPEV